MQNVQLSITYREGWAKPLIRLDNSRWLEGVAEIRMAKGGITVLSEDGRVLAGEGQPQKARAQEETDRVQADVLKFFRGTAGK